MASCGVTSAQGAREIDQHAATAAAEVHRIEMLLLEARGKLSYWRRQRRLVQMQHLVEEHGGEVTDELLAGSDTVDATHAPRIASAVAENVEELNKHAQLVLVEKHCIPVRDQGHPPASKRAKVPRCVACDRIDRGNKKPGRAHTRTFPCRLPPLQPKAQASGSKTKQTLGEKGARKRQASSSESMGGPSTSSNDSD